MPPSRATCSHDHDCGEHECGSAFSLYKHINVSGVRCLNEAVDQSCQKVFKPWERRTERTDQPLSSNDDDPELLIHVPFDGAVKLQAITIIGGPDGTSPSQLKAYINRDDLDFAAVHDLPPQQEWDLQEDFNGVLEYPTQVAKFQGVFSIDLFIPTNFGADTTQIYFIGFKGDFTERRREAVQAVYELRPMPDASKIPGTEAAARESC